MQSIIHIKFPQNSRNPSFFQKPYIIAKTVTAFITVSPTYVFQFSTEARHAQKRVISEKSPNGYTNKCTGKKRKKNTKLVKWVFF